MKFIPTKKADHYFFSVVATYYLLTALLGFGYSSANIIAEGETIPARAIIHGIAGGIWYFLFFLQVFLIIFKKRNLHMKLGNISVPLIIIVFISGIYVILLRDPMPFEKVPFEAMGFELGSFFIGMIYAILGYLYRNNPHYHKRYLLMSIIILSAAGISRFFMFIGVGMFNPMLIIYFIPFLLVFAFDILVYRKIFKATWIGFIIFIFNMFVLSRFFGSIAEFIRPLM